MMHHIRRPVVAGLFYPDDRETLQRSILDMFKHATAEAPQGEIVGILSPHAGYVYSGRIAAEGYRLLQSRSYDNVIVIAPSHFESFSGCSIYPGNYQTPLGIIPSSVDLAAAIISASPVVNASPEGHHRDHALEVQLPFLQIALGNFQLVPLVMGTQDYATAEFLAQAIQTALSDPAFSDQSTLIVSSSDLSHYYSVDTARKKDQIMLQDIQAFDEKKLFGDICSGRCEACGSGTIIATMMISRMLGAEQSKVLVYGTSGDVTREYREVVGYVSGIFYSNN